MSRDAGKRLPGDAGGFTLIELTIVIFVMAIISAIAIPRLRDLAAVELASTARRLSNTTRLLFEEAAFRNATFALNFDLENQVYWVTRFERETGEFTDDTSLLTDRVVLPPDIRILDVVVPAFGKIAEGIVPTYFHPEGFADPAVIHLVDAHDNAYTVRVNPVRGIGEVFDGYQDFERAF